MEREADRLECTRCPFARQCASPPTGPAHIADIGGRDDFVLTVCPRHWVNTHPLVLGDPFAGYMRYKNGLLPETGGWLDQPNVFVECMLLLDALTSETRRRQHARQQAQAESLAATSHPNGGSHVF